MKEQSAGNEGVETREKYREKYREKEVQLPLFNIINYEHGLLIINHKIAVTKIRNIVYY